MLKRIKKSKVRKEQMRRRDAVFGWAAWKVLSDEVAFEKTSQISE